MQISNRQIDSVFKAVSSQLRTEQNQRMKKGSQIAKDGDKAVISTRAAELSKFREILDRTPDVRQDKIAELAERIKNGEYNPPADQVAAKMLLRGLADRLE